MKKKKIRSIDEAIKELLIGQTVLIEILVNKGVMSEQDFEDTEKVVRPFVNDKFRSYSVIPKP